MKTLPAEAQEAERARVRGLAGLPELVRALSTGGLQVYLHVEGDNREVSTLVDWSAYWIIQEALTNIVNHAPGASATVTVHFHEHEVYLSVVDHGWQQSRDRPLTEGRGIIDVRKRAASVGGALDVGPSIAGGCALVAHLPRSSTALDGARSASA
jgi:signal transduction histidine kinase